MSKGSTQRPRGVDAKTFESNWDAIFGKNKKTEAEKQVDVVKSNVDDKYESCPKDSEQGG